MNNNIIEQNFKSRKYYAGITGIKFVPKQHLDFGPPKIKKGDVIPCKKFLFFKPKIKYAQTDLYEVYDYDYDGCTYKSYLSPHDFARRKFVYYDKDNNEFYRKARVIIYYEKDSKVSIFDSDDEAISFIEELKEKCKKCGNELL